MTNKTSAMRYARALLDVAITEKADLDRIEQELAGMAGLFTQYPALAHVLLNPVVPVPRKRAAVAELTALSQLTPMVGKLIAMLADRDRLVLVADLPAAYRDRLLAHRNVIRAEITTTVPLPEDRAKGVTASLASATGRTVSLTTRVDPSIIGGVVARIGSTVYDGSITRQLQKIREQLGEGA
jgi:F-type H+-transporting ATPase subunit delta